MARSSYGGAHAIQSISLGRSISLSAMEAMLDSGGGSLGVNAIVRKGMNVNEIRFHRGPTDIVRETNNPVRGVFLSHLHPDHIGGLSEKPLEVPIYAGQGATSESDWKYLLTQSALDRAFQDRQALQTWKFKGTFAESAHPVDSGTNEAGLVVPDSAA